MGGVVLELDIGNSSAKWRVLGNERLGAGRLLVSEREMESVVEAYNVTAIRAASVASQQVDDVVLGVAKRYQIPCEFARATPYCGGVTNSYEQPSKLGIDRWLAMMAAWQLVAGLVIVVDAGTALTIDIVDQKGRHSGGYILPGRRLLLGVLSSGTEKVRYDEVVGVSASPGVNTGECVEHGCWLSLLAAIREVVAAVAKRQGQLPAVVLTGGDASNLLLLADEDGWLHVEELVLDGLVIALSEECA